MVGGGVVARPSEPRVSTGNRSLDEMLEGGLVAHRPYLIVGPSGTGKTTLAIQFLCEGVRRHERVLLVTLEEPPNEARVNHRGLEPDLDRVEVFDAIPDIMRYERTPFKDIASVRSAIPFAQVPFQIRRSPELASVEVTITALEQMLRTEVIRKGYTRLVIDSLTALQYFCMKGFDPVAGAQSFLRFLSDLRVTTILTVEAPLEDVETAERSLARGEVRLFRWELEGQTVRALGVEKFRGSSHDIRLHPYRIGPQGIDINLETTISRDTRQIIGPIVRRPEPAEAAAPAAPFVSAVTPLIDEMRDLVQLGADVAPARTEIEAALVATKDGQMDQAQAHLSRVSSLVMVLVDQLKGPRPATPADPGAALALQRVLARADSVRTGLPPTSLPSSAVLQVQLGALLSLLPAPGPAPESPRPTIAPEPAAAKATAVLPTLAPTQPTVTVGEAPRVAPEVAPAAPLAKVEPSPMPPTVAETAKPEKVVPVQPPAAKKPLPAPPKPRPSVAVPRAPKPASAPPPRPGPSKGEPPPLPTAPVAEWQRPAAPLSRPPERPPSVAPPAPSSPSVPPAQAPVGAPAAPTKKRRRAAATPPSKKVPLPARASVPPEAPTEAAPGPALGPANIIVPPTPAEPSRSLAPPVHAEPSVSPKPRRRTPRKRKAPPVVSVEVEPIPPGAFGTPDVGSTPRDPPDPSGG